MIIAFLGRVIYGFKTAAEIFVDAVEMHRAMARRYPGLHASE